MKQQNSLDVDYIKISGWVGQNSLKKNLPNSCRICMAGPGAWCLALSSCAKYENYEISKWIACQQIVGDGLSPRQVWSWQVNKQHTIETTEGVSISIAESFKPSTDAAPTVLRGLYRSQAPSACKLCKGVGHLVNPQCEQWASCRVRPAAEHDSIYASTPAKFVSEKIQKFNIMVQWLMWSTVGWGWIADAGWGAQCSSFECRLGPHFPKFKI